MAPRHTSTPCPSSCNRGLVAGRIDPLSTNTVNDSYRVVERQWTRVPLASSLVLESSWRLAKCPAVSHSDWISSRKYVSLYGITTSCHTWRYVSHCNTLVMAMRSYQSSNCCSNLSSQRVKMTKRRFERVCMMSRLSVQLIHSYVSLLF